MTLPSKQTGTRDFRVPALECLWSLDDDESGTWRSACGELWSFIDGGPTENRVVYCHHCGGKVVLEADKEPT